MKNLMLRIKATRLLLMLLFLNLGGVILAQGEIIQLNDWSDKEINGIWEYKPEYAITPKIFEEKGVVPSVGDELILTIKLTTETWCNLNLYFGGNDKKIELNTPSGISQSEGLDYHYPITNDNVSDIRSGIGFGGQKYSISNVRIQKAPPSLVLTPETLSLFVGGESATITTELTNLPSSTIESGTWVWKTSIDGIIQDVSSVTTNSLTVNPLTIGTTTITAKFTYDTDKTLTANCEVTVKGIPSLAAIADLNVQRGATGTISTEITNHIDEKTVVWSVNSEGVPFIELTNPRIEGNTAKVDYTAKAAGTAVVTATYNYDSSKDAITTTCNVTINKKPEISISNTELTLYKGNNQTLTYSTVDIDNPVVNWTATDITGTGVVSVTDGTVTATGYGTAKVTLTVTGNGEVEEVAECTVTVPTPTITINNETLELDVNYTALLSATTANPSGLTVTWSSSAPSIATVDQTGLVTAVAPGQATITAAYIEREATICSASCTVTCTAVATGSGDFGTNSTYEIQGKIAYININTAGDLQYLVGTNFDAIRYVVFMTADGVKMNATDFANMNLFGKAQSVNLDFTYASVLDNAREVAVLNSNGVVIGTARKADPQTTYTYYNDDARSKINAMVNITDRNDDGVLNTLEVFAESDNVHIPTQADLPSIKDLNTELLKVHPNIDDIIIQGAAFNDAASSEWLALICKSFENCGSINSFRVSEYTLQNNSTVALTNPNITTADFSYMWDSGNKQTATLDLSGLSNLQTANLRLANLSEIKLNNLANLTEIDITALNPNTTIDLTGCRNNVIVNGGELFVAAGGTILPANGNYTLAGDTKVKQDWATDSVFIDGSGSSYRFAYEKTVVRIRVKNAGDIAKLADDDTFSRARVVQFITDEGVSLNDADLANLKVFGKKGDVNLDFTYASVSGDWKNAVYCPNNVLLITPGDVNARSFYRNLKWNDELGKVKAVANIYDSNEDSKKNTIELYAAQGEWGGSLSAPMTLYRRLLRLYPNVRELAVYGGLSPMEVNIEDNAKWLEALSVQLSGISEIKSFVVYSYNCGGKDVEINNPNLVNLDFSKIENAGKIDLTGCTNLKSAFFAGAKNISSVDITGLEDLDELNFTNTTGITLTVGASDDLSNVTIYGCNNLSNHSSLPRHICGGDYKPPYEIDPLTDLDITIDLDRGRQWSKYGNPNSLRQFLKMVRMDLARSGNEYIKNADPNHRYNYVKIKGALKPKNMGALNKYVSGIESFTEDTDKELTMEEKFDNGDIVCRYLDLSEARPIANELDGEGNEVPISWSALFNGGSTGGTVLSVNTAAVDYVILPPGLGKDEINEHTFAGFTALKAAGSANTNGTELVAYVKEAGSLYYLTAYINQLNDYNYEPGKTGGRSVCTDDHDGKVGYKHWFYSSEPNNLKHLTLSGNVNAFDLANDVRSKELTYEIIDGHLKVVTATPASAPRREGEKVSTAACAIEEARVASMTGPTGALYFVTLESLDLSDATIEKPIDMTLSGLGSVRATGTDEVFVKIPKNTTELPDNFANNIAPLKEIHLPYTLKTIGYKAFWETNLLHVTCEDEKGNIIDKNPEGGKDKYGNDVVTYALPAKLELIKTGAFAGISEVYITDVYVMATTAPKCQKDAFDASTYMGNFGFKGNDAHPIKRSNYKNGTEASAKLMTILHFPAGIGDDEAMKYTDIDRKYSLQDENGDVNGEGRLKMWPTHSQIYRSYHQALVGVTWKYWSDEDARGGDGPLGTIGDAVDTFTPTTWVDYETVADKTNVYNYDDYMGWHQFVLADYYSFDSDDPVRDFTRFKKNVWYSICFPYNMTKSQLLEYFGAKKTGDYVTVNGTKYYEDVYPEVRTLIQVLRSENEKFITFMFSNDLVRSESKIELSADGKTYSYNTEDVEKDGEDPIIIEGGKPYILRPCYPDDKTNKTTGVRPTAYKSTPNIKLVGTNPYGTTRTDGTVVPYTDHNVWAIDYDATKTSDKIEYANESESVGYMYNFVGAYSSKHVIPQYSYFFGVPKDEFITKLYRDMTTSTTRRPWTQYTAIIGGRATARIDDGDTSAGEIVSNVKLVFTCKNDDLGPVTAGAKPFTYNFAFAGDEGNEPNAIENVTISEDGEIIGNGPIYNLNGIRINGNINSLQKGIYIMNGRKFVVK